MKMITAGGSLIVTLDSEGSDFSSDVYNRIRIELR